MKKDIEIPAVTDIEIAAIFESDSEIGEKSWSIHLINTGLKSIDHIMVTSEAQGIIAGEMRKTTLFRHQFSSLDSNSHLKIELIDPAVFELENRFWLTFFKDGKLYDRQFIFPAQSISEEKICKLTHMNAIGVLAI